MSLQLIHTSALHLLDSEGSGYGTVARSENMSRQLCQRLTALSTYREPRRGCVADGPQFNYHVETIAGQSWHVLTCTSKAGADYSGRACHISHHLVLSQDEVLELLDNELRPTPAGVILSLLNSGYWKFKWEGPPCFISDEPELRPGDLPDASAQPTWKHLTGHKANARAFFTPPYDRDCLITLKKGTAIQDILRLFHESDWLTNTRGWGVSFTTAADDADSFAETLRMVVVPDSPLVQRAHRTGHPVLEITGDMELPVQVIDKQPPGSLPMEPPPAVAGAGFVRTLSRSVSHYHYTEEPDWLLYDVRPGIQRCRWGIPVAASCMLAGILLSAWAYYAPAPSSPAITAGDDTDEPTGMIACNGVQKLAALTGSEYDRQATQALLSELVRQEEASPEDHLLLEAVVLLQRAQQPGVQHAVAMKRLCECARLLGIKDTDMARLYLREATYHVTPEDWQKQFNGQQAASWIALRKTEPQAFNLLEESAFKPYAPILVEPAAPRVLATVKSMPEAGDELSTQTDQPVRISLIPSPAVAGEKLPEPLLKLIPKLPIIISAGTYVVSSFEEGGNLQPAQKQDLSQGAFSLSLAPAEQAGEYSLKPLHADGRPSPLPEVRFSVKAGRLHSVRCGQHEAVVAFPVPTDDNFHTNIILAPRFGIPIPTGNEPELPPAAKANLDICVDDLVIIPPSGQSAAPHLQLRKRKGAPWTLTRREMSRILFNLELPVLTGHNTAFMEDEVSPAGYEWVQAKVLDESETRTQLRCEMIYRPDLPGRLERTFETVSNSPCCGEGGSTNPAMTLANLYYISCAMASDKLSIKEKRMLNQSYYELYADKGFNPILHRIFERDRSILLSRKEATSRHLKAANMRRNVSKMLEERQMRDVIRQRVCEVLTRSMYAAYTAVQESEKARLSNPPVFILKKIGIGDHAELIWYFCKENVSDRP
ncbi:MAG: hypothetical protein IKA23_02130 [Akkermansia sp.]|nr:hypothetical protein [Akkermansia sp.]MBR2314233.1 hypothetical protein [Akkermansia sp.]